MRPAKDGTSFCLETYFSEAWAIRRLKTENVSVRCSCFRTSFSAHAQPFSCRFRCGEGAWLFLLQWIYGSLLKMRLSSCRSCVETPYSTVTHGECIAVWFSLPCHHHTNTTQRNGTQTLCHTIYRQRVPIKQRHHTQQLMPPRKAGIMF